jgi:polysaccharide deacetylase 2 family uncharacterized protein YibQ
MRKRFDDEEQRPSRLWRFVKGVLTAVVVSAGAVAVLSVYVLPPPEPPAPEPAADTGPEMVSGIEVATTPAYTDPSGSASPGSDGAGSDGADAPAPEPETLTPVELSGPALAVNSVPFEADPGTPLVAVVLDDTAANPLLHELLFSMNLPFAVGVIAGGGGDRETANAARAAGLEVVAQLPLARQGESGGAALEYGLPEGEAADRTLTLMQRLPMAIAAARPLSAPARPNASVQRGMAATLEPLGFAYVDHGVVPGDGSTFGVEGVAIPIGVSRFTIPAGASAAETVAALDLAAADAVQRGTAVVFATPGEQLFLALQLWGGEGSGSLALLAPLSAVIRRQNGTGSGG